MPQVGEGSHLYAVKSPKAELCTTPFHFPKQPPFFSTFLPLPHYHSLHSQACGKFISAGPDQGSAKVEEPDVWISPHWEVPQCLLSR